MRIEIRELRYFVALAEELNFTRAAERLHVVQQSMSSAIARLETNLGFKLFKRSSHSVALTDSGATWLLHAREVLAAADRAERAARDLAAGRASTLRIGLAATAAVELTPVLLSTFAEQNPLIHLVTQHFGFDDPTGGLRTGETDVAIVRPPFTRGGVDLVVVGAEARYVAVTGAHPLARQSTTTFERLIDEPWIKIESDPLWCDFWRVNDRRSSPPVFGAHGRGLEDLLEAARDGRAIGLVPASIANSQQWPGLAFVEVTDIPASEIAVAWRAESASPAVRTFVALAAEIANKRAHIHTTTQPMSA